MFSPKRVDLSAPHSPSHINFPIRFITTIQTHTHSVQSPIPVESKKEKEKSKSAIMVGGSRMFGRIAAVMVAVALLGVAEAQSTPPTATCASKLVPCANYLNSTRPPASCCDPLREAVTNELPCLCNLYRNPQFLASININITQALLLPRYCNIPGDLSACNALSPNSSPTGTTPGGAGGNNSNGVDRLAWTGISSLLLFWASVFLV